MTGFERRKPKECAFQKIIELAARQELASAKVHSRLLKYGYLEDEVAEAIERAVACGIIDDNRYADCYLRSRIASGKGVSGVLKELEQLGIDYEGNDSIQDQIIELEDEEERALRVLINRPPRSKNQREGAYRKLVSQGYSSQVASTVARRWAAEHNS